jgi:hypothetical protein
MHLFLCWAKIGRVDFHFALESKCYDQSWLLFKIAKNVKGHL